MPSRKRPLPFFDEKWIEIEKQQASASSTIASVNYREVLEWLS